MLNSYAKPLSIPTCRTVLCSMFMHAHDLDLAPHLMLENALPQPCMKLVHCPMGCCCGAVIVEALTSWHLQASQGGACTYV